MNTKIAAVLALGAVSLLTTAGCSGSADDTATDQAAINGPETAAAPFKCTLTLMESIPVKRIEFNIVPGGADGCRDEGIPDSQITKTETFNAAPAGAKVLCASRGQSGGDGKGSGVAFFHFRSKVTSAEFEMKPECNPQIPQACFAQLSGKDALGFTVMMSGSSADKTEKMALVHGSFVPKLDKAAGMFDLDILGSHSFFDPEKGESGGGDGSASALAMVSAPKIELSTSFNVKSIDGFGLDDDLELSCTR